MHKKKVVSNAVCGGFGCGVVWTVHGLPARSPPSRTFSPCCLVAIRHATFCAMHGSGAVFYLGRRIKALFIVLLVRSSL